MKRNTNAVFKAFNDQICADFLAAGLTPSPLSWHPETPVFTVPTVAGDYVCHHGMNVDPNDRRPLNYLNVFGKFKDPKAAAQIVDSNPFNGKWNHAEEVLYVPTVEEARSLASSIVTRILKFTRP